MLWFLLYLLTQLSGCLSDTLCDFVYLDFAMDLRMHKLDLSNISMFKDRVNYQADNYPIWYPSDNGPRISDIPAFELPVLA